MRLWQREEGEEGTAGGDCGSKGGWLQPLVARRGGRMGDSDAIEGWKAVATREEKEAGVNGGWQRWLLTGVGGYVAGPVTGDRTAGDKRPEQQGCVGGLRQRVEAAVAGEAAMRAGSRGGGGLHGEDGEGQRWPVGGGCGRVDVWGSCCGRGDGDMVVGGSSREERNRGGRRRKRR
ncbi:hypothetical protein B296_00028310 [Ensete ventricosum]|uniref:DUF834 domain-containing protein n=1 Tax=Ensete ventricosum TaxID=4639 RepID=A0A426ZJ11_ENSVE|nr:hypothetical protein B296_00028310 [Ensete ventricosum]